LGKLTFAKAVSGATPSPNAFSRCLMYSSRTKVKSEVAPMKQQEWQAHDGCTHMPNSTTKAAIEESDRIMEALMSGNKPPDFQVFDSAEAMLEGLNRE